MRALGTPTTTTTTTTRNRSWLGYCYCIATSWVWLGCILKTVEAVTVPAAIGVEPSQYWEGNDGPWSSFPIRVGTPAQDVRVFISTAATSTWVIGVMGCEMSGAPSNCTSIRGDLFNTTASSSWVQNGNFGLYAEDNLGLQEDADFGFETVGLGFQGSGGPTMNHTVTAWIETTDFLIGMLGLNPRPTNFSTFNDPQTSYLSLLYEQDEIPSLSYSYTAGAQYRFNGVLGSLTLGGYDEGMYDQVGQSFGFYYDQTRDLTVGLQKITATNTGTTSLLPGGILTLIDTTVPQIWLPLAACQLFERAFGLTYDNNTGLYLVNDTQHAALVSQNSSITFTLGQTITSTPTVDITLPYAAFDLEVSYPIESTLTRYFPLRRAANDTQYTLGRVFLQEAYLTIDYHRSNFTVSQRSWAVSQTKHIVSIFPPNSTTSSSTTTSGTNSSNTAVAASTKIAKGAIAGIAVAAVVAIISAFVAGWFFFNWRKRKEDEKKSAELAAMIIEEQNEPKSTLPPQTEAAELIGTSYKYIPRELHADHFFTGAEVDGTAGSERRFELGSPEGVEGRVELEAPHGTGELSGAKPEEIQPPPPFSDVSVPARSASETEAGKARAARPFSWQAY